MLAGWSISPRFGFQEGFILGRLTYTTINSLDGFIADERGSFDWAVPDADVHGFINELQRPVGTYLYGRKMYEVMKGW